MSENSTDGFLVPIDSIIAERRTAQNQQAAQSTSKEQIRAVLEETTNQLNNVSGILELHPDLKLCMEIRTAMILSPKDMVTPKLRLALDQDVFPVDEKTTELLSDITAHFRTKTRLEKDMAKFIDEALFLYGSHVWLMLPPNTLDMAIQGKEVGMESITEFTPHCKNHGLISPTDETLSEFKKLGVDGVIDNLNILRQPAIEEVLRHHRDAEVSMESYGNAPFFRNKKRELLRLSSDVGKDNDGGDPIIFEIPPDCILPIHDPSDPSRHVAYMIQVDEHGSITSEMEESNYFEKLQKRLLAASKSDSSEDYAMLKNMGFEGKVKEEDPAGLLRLYRREMERNIEQAVRTTGADGHFRLKDHEPFYRMMFSRALESRNTRLLYVPNYMVDYMAFDYNSMGHGVSLLEKTQLYSSLRAVVMFSDLIRQMSNSIPQRDLNITLDAKDRDGPRTVRNLVHEYGRIIDRSIPLGTFSPSSMIDELRRSGIRVNVDGGERYPNTKLEVEDRQRQIARVDDELAEQLKRAQYAGLSVPPEVIDQSLQGEFAINTVTSNQLFAKRSMVDQDRYIELMRERMRKYIYLSNTLYGMISNTVGEDKVDDFIDALYPALPRADEVRIEQQIDSFNRYADFIDTVMEVHISDTMLRGLITTDLSGDALEEIRAIFAAHFKREYLISENILPELQRLYVTEDAESIADRINGFHEDLFKTVGSIVKGLTMVNTKLQKVEDKATQGEEDNASGNADRDDRGYGSFPSWDFPSEEEPETSPVEEEDLPAPEGEPEPEEVEEEEELPPTEE